MATVAFGSAELARQTRLLDLIAKQQAALAAYAKKPAAQLSEAGVQYTQQSEEALAALQRQADEAMAAYITAALQAADGDDSDPDAYAEIRWCIPKAGASARAFQPFAEFLFDPWLQRLLVESKMLSQQPTPGAMLEVMRRLRAANTRLPTIAQLASFSAMDPRFFTRQRSLLNVMATGTGKTMAMFGAYYRAVMASYSDYRRRAIWAGMIYDAVKSENPLGPDARAKLPNPKFFLPTRCLPLPVVLNTGGATVFADGDLGRPLTVPFPSRPEPMLAVHVAPLKVIDQTIGELREMARAWGLGFEEVGEAGPLDPFFSSLSAEALQEAHGSVRPDRGGADAGDFWFLCDSLLPLARVNNAMLFRAVISAMNSANIFNKKVVSNIGVGSVRCARMFLRVDNVPPAAQHIMNDGQIGLSAYSLREAFDKAVSSGRNAAEVRIVFVSTDAMLGAPNAPVESMGSFMPVHLFVLPSVTHVVIDEAHMLVAISDAQRPAALEGADGNAQFLPNAETTVTGRAWARPRSAAAIAVLHGARVGLTASAEEFPMLNSVTGYTAMTASEYVQAALFDTSRAASAIEAMMQPAEQLQQPPVHFAASAQADPTALRELYNENPNAALAWVAVGNHYVRYCAAALANDAQRYSEALRAIGLGEQVPSMRLDKATGDAHLCALMFSSLAQLASRSSPWRRSVAQQERFVAGAFAGLAPDQLDTAVALVEYVQSSKGGALLVGDGKGLTTFASNNPSARGSMPFMRVTLSVRHMNIDAFQPWGPFRGLMLMTGTPAATVEGAMVLRNLVRDGITGLLPEQILEGGKSMVQRVVVHPAGPEVFEDPGTIDPRHVMKAYPLAPKPTAVAAPSESAVRDWETKNGTARTDTKDDPAGVTTLALWLKAFDKRPDDKTFASFMSFMKPGLEDTNDYGNVVFYEGEARLMPWLACPVVGMYKVWQFAGSYAEDRTADLPKPYPSAPATAWSLTDARAADAKAEHFYPAGPSMGADEYAMGRNVSDPERFSVFDMTAAHPDQFVPTDQNGFACDITRFDAVFLTIHRILRSRAFVFGKEGAYYGASSPPSGVTDALTKDQWDSVEKELQKPLPSERLAGQADALSEADGVATFKTLVLYLGPPELWPVFCDFGQADFMAWANPDQLASAPEAVAKRVAELVSGDETERVVAQLEQDVVANNWATEPLALAPAPHAAQPTDTIARFLSGRYGVDVLLLNGHEAVGVDTKGVDLVILVGGSVGASSADLNMQSVGRLLRAGSTKTGLPVFAAVICSPLEEYAVQSAAVARAFDAMQRSSLTRCVVRPTAGGCRLPTNACADAARKKNSAAMARIAATAEPMSARQHLRAELDVTASAVQAAVAASETKLAAGDEEAYAELEGGLP